MYLARESPLARHNNLITVYSVRIITHVSRWLVPLQFPGSLVTCCGCMMAAVDLPSLFIWSLLLTHTKLQKLLLLGIVSEFKDFFLTILPGRQWRRAAFFGDWLHWGNFRTSLLMPE